jgi:N-acetylated-alpha-linked acidic dipeptidase
MREETSQLNLELKDNMFTEVSDPTKISFPPKPEDPVPFLNFAPLENAVNTLQKKADEYQKAKNEFMKSGINLTEDQAKNLDQLIYQSERFLTNKEGLTGRPWYVHEIYAPGFYTGYGVKTLPAVREAVESRNWDEANKQSVVVANTLNNYSSEIVKATALIESYLK